MNDWIKTTDAMPPMSKRDIEIDEYAISEDVLFIKKWEDGTCTMSKGVFSYEAGKWIMDSGKEINISRVSHWMLVPKLPEGLHYSYEDIEDEDEEETVEL